MSYKRKAYKMTNTLSNDNFQVKSCLNNFLNTCSYITSQVNCEKNPQKKNNGRIP